MTEEPLTDFTQTPEGAIATLGIVLKELGGEVRVSPDVLAAGFVEGDYVDVEYDEDTKEIVVSVKNNG